VASAVGWHWHLAGAKRSERFCKSIDFPVRGTDVVAPRSIRYHWSAFITNWSDDMRLCRFKQNGQVQAGFYDDQFVVPVAAAAELYAKASSDKLGALTGDNLLDFLPPDGKHFAATKKIADWMSKTADAVPVAAKLAHDAVEILVPIPNPSKLLLLAGNYNEHLTEAERGPSERKRFHMCFGSRRLRR
jgi:hypothetical protein